MPGIHDTVQIPSRNRNRQSVPSIDIGLKQLLRSGNRWFRKGLLLGTAFGAVAGLAPGLLLVLILSGGNYHVGSGELLGFIVMSIFALAVAGAALGGASAFVAGMFLSGLHTWAARKRTAKR